MACDAIARLYDVDEDSVVFKKHDETEKYDQGTFTFQARKGQAIDLDQLHESVWATRLSGSTRSGLVSLDVTAVGRVVNSGGKTMLAVADSDAEFALQRHPDGEHAAVFGELEAGAFVKVTGRIADYRGQWPNLLRKQPQKPRRILVSSVEVLSTH